MKSKADKFDIVKLETNLINLGKLGDLVKSEVIKKTAYDELVKKVNAIQTTDTEKFDWWNWKENFWSWSW